MNLVNSILADLFEKVLKEARNLMIFSKRSTLSSKEIESAVKLLFPGELQKLAVQTGRSTLQKLQASANQ
jgi:histone H2B